jgi:hypothetical protein
MPTKVGRPKNRKPKDIRFATPKDEGVYQAKRLYWALLMYEEKMAKDITAVSIKDYLLLVETFKNCITEQKRKGKIEYKYANKIDTRMDEKRLAQGDSVGEGSQGISQDGSTGVGAGVRTVNPIT